jgi:hypothetical protein
MESKGHVALVPELRICAGNRLKLAGLLNAPAARQMGWVGRTLPIVQQPPRALLCPRAPIPAPLSRS